MKSQKILASQNKGRAYNSKQTGQCKDFLDNGSIETTCKQSSSIASKDMKSHCITLLFDYFLVQQYSASSSLHLEYSSSVDSCPRLKRLENRASALKHLTKIWNGHHLSACLPKKQILHNLNRKYDGATHCSGPLVLISRFHGMSQGCKDITSQT